MYFTLTLQVLFKCSHDCMRKISKQISKCHVTDIMSILIHFSSHFLLKPLNFDFTISKFWDSKYLGN